MANLTQVTNAYVDEQEAREWLGIGGDTMDRGRLVSAINTASRAVDKWCQRRFWQDATVTARTYRARESLCVYVDDISTTTGLVVKTDDGGDGTYSTTWTIGTDFILEPLNADSSASTAFSWWKVVGVGTKAFPRNWYRPSVQVTAKWGFATVPPEVEQATLLLTNRYFALRNTPLGATGNLDLGVVRISTKDKDVIDLLAEHRRYRIDT